MDAGIYEAPPVANQVNTIVLAFTVVAGLIVSLRLFARIFLISLFGPEDVLIVLAMGFSIGLSATVSQQTTHGLGTHISELGTNEQRLFFKAFWVGLWVHSLALTITKVSALTQYLRIFPIHRFRISCYCLLGLVVALGAWAVASNIFICNAIDSAWIDRFKRDDCMDRKLIWFTNSGISIALDLIILLLPVPLIRTLQIPASQKRGFVTIIALSICAPIISIIRLHTISRIAKSTDLPFDNIGHAILSSLEVNAVIICACLPAMRPLLALMMPKYFSKAAQFTNVPTGYDIEQPKHMRTPSRNMVVKSIQSKTIESGTSTPRAPQPTLSRTSSGRFTVTHSRPSTAHQTPTSGRSTPGRSTPGRNTPVRGSPGRATPGRATPLGHSRSGSNISIDIAAADARSNGLRPPRRTNPLRLSPITPGGSDVSLPESMYNAGISNDSHADLIHVWGPERKVASKPLPLTPFPVRAHRG
ncbi:hypothetical protein HBI76_083620 [Parastagonospora nodorum]|nr:hypothetical protein HBI76_083620 [Parastagonospora nodorum]